MKTIRTGFGVRKIEDGDEGNVLFQLRELLTAHRATLIQRLTSDLPTYIEYQFHLKAGKQELDDIRVRLHELKNSSVELDQYNQIVGQVLEKDMTFVLNEPFYQELNACIGLHLREPQLNLR